MEALRILIVEDEFIIASNLKNILEDLNYIPLAPAGTYKEAIQKLETSEVDLAILDINLNGKNEGIEIAKFINEKIHIPFIYLTSNADKETINLAKQTNPKSYLIKPFTEDDIYSAIEIAISNLKVNDSEEINIFNDSIFIKLGSKYYKVNINEITYFEADGKLMNIHNVKNQKFTIRTSLENLLMVFKGHNFLRVHRSFCVNTKFLEIINGEFVIINGQQIPIGRNYREQLISKIRTLS